MTFFEEQARAKRSSTRLVGYFIAAVVAIVIAVYLAVIFIFFAAGSEELQLWIPDVFIVVAVGVAALIGIGSAAKTASLKSGGARVAEMLGGQIIQRDTKDPDQRKILNVVDEMSIASGIPAPPVYLLPDESINAFAAGYTVDDAVVGVTRGCVQLLNRDELQGVIAHEFSHILNGDMRLNIRLIGLLHGILLLSTIGYILMRSMRFSGRRSGNNNGGLAILLFGVVLLALGYIGVFFGRLIKAAVSRQREFLADASAVQFTRNPLGIGGALKKIGGFTYGSKIDSPQAEETSHLFFSNALGASYMAAFATHPPLKDRIKKIDPHFDGKFITPEPPKAVETISSTSNAAKKQRGGGADRFILSADKITDLATGPQAKHLIFASALLAAIPEKIQDDIHNPFSARAGIFALLLDRDLTIREKQLNLIKESEDDQTLKTTQQIAKLLEELGQAHRLPMLDLLLPALKQLSDQQYLSFRETVRKLALADNQTSLFEYLLHHALKRHVEASRTQDTSKKSGGLYLANQVFQQEAMQLLAFVAFHGANEDSARNSAFTSGIQALGVSGVKSLDSFNVKELSLLDKSLKKLESISPERKEKVLEATLAVINADGTVTIDEMELLRLIGDALDVPLPPILPDS